MKTTLAAVAMGIALYGLTILAATATHEYIVGQIGKAVAAILGL